LTRAKAMKFVQRDPSMRFLEGTGEAAK